MVEILGASAIMITLAALALISVKDTLTAGQRSSAQRELQVLNTSLANFKSAGGGYRC